MARASVSRPERKFSGAVTNVFFRVWQTEVIIDFGVSQFPSTNLMWLRFVRIK